jgi:hypothetical protein
MREEEIAEIVLQKNWYHIPPNERHRVRIISGIVSDAPPEPIREAEVMSRRFLSKYKLSTSVYNAKGNRIQNFESGLPAQVREAYKNLLKCSYKPTKKVKKDEIVLYLTFNPYVNYDWQIFNQLDAEDKDTYFKVAADIHSKLGEKSGAQIWRPWFADKNFARAAIEADRLVDCINPALAFIIARDEFSSTDLKNLWEMYGYHSDPLTFTVEQIEYLRDLENNQRWNITELFKQKRTPVKSWSFLATQIVSIQAISLFAAFICDNKIDVDVIYKKPEWVKAKFLWELEDKRAEYKKMNKSLRKIAKIWDVPKDTLNRRIHEIQQMCTQNKE